MSSAGAGDARAPDHFAQVVEAHWPAVYRLLYSLCGNAHDSEDLAQETFLRAMRRWDSFRSGTNLRAWLLRIATNAYFDLRRKKKILKFSSIIADLPSAAPAAESTLEVNEEKELMRVAVAELTELTRLVFHLRVSEQLSFKEIAELAGVTEVAARQHMHQARTKLLKRLSGSPLQNP